MTASLPTHSSSWDRVLPAPHALLNGQANNPLSRRTSSLLHHHLANSKDPPSSPKERRSTFPSISYNVEPPSNRIPSIQTLGSRDPETGLPTQTRAASLMAAESSSGETSPLTHRSVSGPTDQFCLCQPDPKIPRPRNAFILYRQHHQAAVVDKHPGLPNPEISKIIGEEWRALNPETKHLWKNLAEAEKTRHQQQYPDYRYQPRRLGRNAPPQAAPTTGGTGPAGNCLRCGGKAMNPPMTPHTPAFPPNAGLGGGVVRSSATKNAPHPPGPRRPHPLGHAGYHRQVPYTVPSPPPSGSAITRIRPFGEVYAGGVLQSGAEAEYRSRYASQPMSPSPKRRRYNGPGVMVPGRTAEVTSPVAAYPAGHPYSPRRMSVSRASEAVLHSARHRSPTHGFQMQRAGAPPSQHGRYVPVGARDPSLTLAPLKTPDSATGALGSNGQKRAIDSTSAEAQIMSMRLINKLRLLAKAAPPLPQPRSTMTKPASPPAGQSIPQSRGAILAIEGSEEDVGMMTEWLAEFLNNEGDGFRVKAFQGPKIGAVIARKDSEEEADVVGTQQQRYLKAISEWHWVSQEVVKFVSHATTSLSQETGTTTAAAAPYARQEGVAAAQPKREVPDKAVAETSADARSAPEPEHMDIDSTSVASVSLSSSSSAVSPRTIAQTEQLSLTSPKNMERSAAGMDAKTDNSNPALPVALVPRYQLSTVDTASLSMPITDSYLPIDHWQWAAALWRGCAGADVTIVIQESSGLQSPPGSGGGTGPGGGNAGAGVEVRLGMGDVKAVVVRKASRSAGSSEGGNGSPKPSIEPGQLRRVGFEIAEFLRR